MTDEYGSGGVLMIRAWRDSSGVLRIRLTEVVEGENAELDMTTVVDDDEALAVVRNWLQKLRN